MKQQQVIAVAVVVLSCHTEFGALPYCMPAVPPWCTGWPGVLTAACQSLCTIIRDEACAAQQALRNAHQRQQQRPLLELAVIHGEVLLRLWCDWGQMAERALEDDDETAASADAAWFATLPAIAELALVLLRSPVTVVELYTSSPDVVSSSSSRNGSDAGQAHARVSLQEQLQQCRQRILQNVAATCIIIVAAVHVDVQDRKQQLGVLAAPHVLEVLLFNFAVAAHHTSHEQGAQQPQQQGHHQPGWEQLLLALGVPAVDIAECVRTECPYPTALFAAICYPALVFNRSVAEINGGMRESSNAASSSSSSNTDSSGRGGSRQGYCSSTTDSSSSQANSAKSKAFVPPAFRVHCARNTAAGKRHHVLGVGLHAKHVGLQHGTCP